MATDCVKSFAGSVLFASFGSDIEATRVDADIVSGYHNTRVPRADELNSRLAVLPVSLPVEEGKKRRRRNSADVSSERRAY